MIPPEQRAALRDVLEEQRRCGSRGAGSRCTVLARGLDMALESVDAADALLVDLLEVLALRKPGRPRASQLVANVRESVAVNKAGRYLERAGKLGSALASIRAIEEGGQP